MTQRSPLGAKPELRWIKLTQLYIPSEYQRPTLGKASVKAIAEIREHFNWSDFGVLIVCELEMAKPPQYAVIDGQHRFKAAEGREDIDSLPCAIITRSTLKEQAQTFITMNTKRLRLHALHEYRAAIAAGNQDALTLDAILKRAKVTIVSYAMSPRDVPPRATQAIGTLFKMMRDYNEKHIVWAFDIITSAFDKTNGCLRASMLKTMTEWHKMHPETDRDIMIQALSGINIDQLEKDARAYRAVEKKSVPEAIMLIIERRYNATKRNVA